MALNRNSAYNPNDTSWMDAGVEPTERGSVSKALKFIFGVGKGIVVGTAQGALDSVKEDYVPNLEKVEDVISDAQQSASKSLKELTSGLSEFKSAAKQVALKYTEGASAFMPQGMYRRLSRAFEEEQTYEESPEERFESSLSSNLSSVFSAQAKHSTALHKVSMQSAAVDRALRAKYHTQTMRVATATGQAVGDIDRFLNTTYLNYLKKDLELKYRSYHTSTIIKGYIDEIAGQFRKDGLMPDLLEAASMSDKLKQAKEMENAGGGGKQIASTQGYFKSLAKNIAENATTTPTMILSLLSMGLGMEGSMPLTDSSEFVQRIASMASPWSLGFLKRHLLSKKSQKKVDKWWDKTKDKLGTFNEDLGYLLGNKSALANSFGSFLRGREGWLPRWIGNLFPEFQRTTRADNKAAENPTAPATFDNLTRESIISIIPAHLERIGNQLEAFVRAQGIQPSPDQDKVYDVRTRRLVTRTERRKRNLENLYGTGEERLDRAKANVTVFLDMIQGIDDVNLMAQANAELLDHKEDIHMFIMRSARVNRTMNITALMKTAKGNTDQLNDEETEYIKHVFGTTGDYAINTARLILKACSTRNKAGRTTGINHNYVRMVNTQITRMSRELDESDEMRGHLEDLGYMDEEDYQYDAAGNAQFDEKSRTRQFGKDWDRYRAAEKSTDARAREELLIASAGSNDKAEAATAKFLRNLKGKTNEEKYLASRAALATGMNSFGFLPGWMLSGVAGAYNWTVDEIDDLGITQGLKGNDWIRSKLEKFSAGKKNKIVKIRPAGASKKDATLYLFTVSILSTAGLRDTKTIALPYKESDFKDMHMVHSKQPSPKLEKLVSDVIKKLGGSEKFEAAYSDNFWSPWSDDEDEETSDWYSENTTSVSATREAGTSSVKTIRHSIVDFLASLDENVVALRNKITGSSVRSVLGEDKFRATMRDVLSRGITIEGFETAEQKPPVPEIAKRYSRIGNRELIATEETEWENEQMTQEEVDHFRRSVKARLKRNPELASTLEEFNKAVEAGDWATARRLSNTQTSNLVDNEKKNIFDRAAAANVDKLFDKKKASFDNSVDGANQIAARFKNDMMILRRAGSSATVRKHLNNLAEALAIKDPKKRTIKMIDALDAIESSQILYEARHGKSQEYYRNLNNTMELSEINPLYMPEEEENEFLNEADVERAAVLKERIKKYIDMGADLAPVQGLLIQLEMVKSSKQATKIMDTIDSMLKKADEATKDIQEKVQESKKKLDEHPKTKSLKETFNRHAGNLKDLVNAAIAGDMESLKKNELATSLFAKAKEAMEAAQKAAKKRFRKPKKGSDAYYGIEDASEVFDETEAGEFDEEEEGGGFLANVWNGIKGIFGGSSSYADGSAKRTKTLRYPKYKRIEINQLLPAAPDKSDQPGVATLFSSKKKNLWEKLKNSRIMGALGSVLNNLKKVTKIDDPLKVIRSLVRSGMSIDTAAMLGFMSSVAHKIDRSILEAGDRAAAEMAQRYDADGDSFWQWMPKKYQRKLKAYKRLYTTKAKRWMKAAGKRSKALARLYKGKALKAIAPYLAKGKDLLIAGKEGLIHGLSATGGALKNFGLAAVPRLKAIGNIGANAITKYMPAFSTAGGALASLGLGALGGGMGALGSASSGAGKLSQAFSGITGGAAGLLALSNPAVAAGLAAAMGANALREGWNDKKTLEASWGAANTASDYQKGSTAVGNLANYLTFGLLNKYGGRKYVDRLAQYSNLSHVVGGIGGQIAGAGQMLKSVFGGESSAMTELELKRARAKFTRDIQLGVPDAESKLEAFEKAVEEKNWYRARELSGIHFEASKVFMQGLKRYAKGGLAISTLGISSMIEMGYDKLIGNKDKPLDKKEIDRALKNFAIREKKDPAVKEIRLQFEEAVAGERWAIARKLAKIEDVGLLARKFGKGWGTTAGALAVAGGPIGSMIAGGIMLFANNENEPMSEKEISDFEQKCQRLIDQGNERAKTLLDKFEDAVANGRWSLARKLSGKETQSLFMKGAKAAYRSFRYLNIFGWGFTDQNESMRDSEIVKFRDKMNYLISKGDQVAKAKLEKFDIAVMNNDWKTARKISETPHRSVWAHIGTGIKDAARWLFYADQDKPMTEAEITKFRASMERKVERGEPGAQQILDKFNDAVGTQQWRKAREISKIKNTSVLGDIGNWFKKGYNAVDRWFSGGNDEPMSEDEINKFTARMEKLIDLGNMAAKQALDHFRDACEDGDWRKARRISGMNYESLGARIGRWFRDDDQNLSDEKQTSNMKVAQRYRLIFDRVKEAMGKPHLAQFKPMLATLRNDMQSTDLIELDDEMLNRFEDRLREIDHSVGMTDEREVAAYDEERKSKLKLVQQRDALLTEIAAAQERCPWRESTRRGELKRLFREVSDLTMDELDQEILDSYDEELRLFDKDALTTKAYSEEERKKHADNYNRKEVLLRNIDEALDRCSWIGDGDKKAALRQLKGDVYSTLVEEIDDDMFTDWDSELKSLDKQARSSKTQSKEEIKKMRELQGKRLILTDMIKKSISKCGFFETSKKNGLKKLLDEVEAELDEDLTDELLADWEDQLKELDETASTIEETQQQNQLTHELLRERRKLRTKMNLQARKFGRGKTLDEQSNGKAIAQIVTRLDAIADEDLKKEDLTQAEQEFNDIMGTKAEEQSTAQPATAPTVMSSGANEQAVSLDKNGNIVDMKEGSPTKVSLKTAPGGQIIHTHPDGSPTSATDIASAIANGQTAVTTLRSSNAKVTGFSGSGVTPETIKLEQKKAEQNNAELHSLFTDMKSGIKAVGGATLGNRDVLTGIYERLGDVIEAIGEHNVEVNDKIDTTAMRSYGLSRQFTINKLKQKVKDTSPVFRPSAIAIGK